MSASLPSLTLVLGGARSGKSAHAESLVVASGLQLVYIATAQALDGEMRQRIRHHRDRRSAAWLTVEAPLELAAAIATHTGPERAILVDCLTLWLTNVLLADRNPEAEGDQLLAALAAATGPVVLVSNEVGLGIVPLDALSRAFVDHAGRLHQRLAQAADWVRFVAAGLPLDLKAPPACTC
ncbi:MAG: bifunctional adenosylcobinamide kinase/adenosylcobinamide-phosphate guanylyltransferase [Geminicoccaceae bacterium]